MKGFFRPQRRRNAGFTAILNNAIMVCKFYYDMTNQTDILIEDDEMSKLFDFYRPLDTSDYTFDVNGERHLKYDKGELIEPSKPHKPIIKEELVKKNIIFNKFFKIKDIDFYESERKKFINDKTICVHLRGTDKPTEISIPEIENVYNHIDYMLNNYEVDNIFLATDDNFYQSRLIERYGDMVKFREKTISMNGQPIHFIEDRDQINKEVMIDSYLLSSGKYFLYSLSNVSYLSLIMGVNNHLYTNCLNDKINY